MSSDAFADLGGSLRKVAEGLMQLVDVNKRPAPGSPAGEEADGEPFAGEWSAHPARDLAATLLMECWSCTSPPASRLRRRLPRAHVSAGQRLPAQARFWP